jgi:regulator of sigma E protease
MLSILGFILILAPLVVVHEMGHFLMARLFGVKAEVFSVGFGPTIWSRQRGETEWKLSAVPLGGYVKLLGEEPGQELPPELASRSLQRALPWKRFMIFFGGPLFNFIFASIVFMAIQVIGEEQPKSVVGRVLPASIAASTGLMTGDEVFEVAGKPVSTFEDMAGIFAEYPAKKVEFKVHRPGISQVLNLNVTPASVDGYSAFGEKIQQGEVTGLLPAGRDAIVGVSSPNSAGAVAGVKTGDRIKLWNGQTVKNFEEIEAWFVQVPKGQQVMLEMEPSCAGAKGAEKDCRKPYKYFFTKSGKTSSFSEETGVYSSELFVEKPVEKSPAAGAGLIHGDRLIAVNGENLTSFFDLREKVQKSGEAGKRMKIEWERDGKLLSSDLDPTPSEVRDPELKKSKQFTVGVYPMLAWAEMPTVVERTLNPFLVVYRGITKMITHSWRNLVSIGKMFTGGVSVKTLGGPILIGKIAGESISRGLISFLTTMAILSIGLGVLNVLPVPLLDGGHILLLGVEKVRGKPLQENQMELFQKVGLALILLLMVVVMKNDLTRIF